MENDLLVLNLVKQNKTLEEIVDCTNLPLKDIYKILKRIREKGYLISKKYYYDGEIKYNLQNNLEKESDIILYTSHKDNEFEFMVISDLHFGSFYETSKLLNIIYDYCTNKNINIILNAGDFVDGDVNKQNIKIEPIKQITHALKCYPISKNIISYLLLGNHDYSLINNYGMDISKVISDNREDIVPIGYGEGIIKIKNDLIIMQHPLLYEKSNNGIYSKSLIIRGHGHKPKINFDTSNLVIYAPSLSKLNFNNCNYPGAIDLKIKMRCGIVETVYIEQLAFINNKINVTNELNIYFGHNKSFKDRAPISNEEEYPKVLRKEK